MALKGLDIFKLSPKKNCKECGSPTCMAFCMKVAQGAVTIDKCPYFDPAAVAQVFENLLGNALRFAGSKVAVRLEGGGDALTLRVADDGPGFTEKELLTAARPYYSGRRDGDGCHFGLGLHICRTLCEKHGGGLTLANGESGGAEVTARFAMGPSS